MDHSLEDLFEIMRIVSDSRLSCGNHSENASEWCDHYDNCNGCRAALIDAIERKIADEYVRLPKSADDEAITDELRKWFDRYTMRKNMYDELTAIADRIDAAHEKALSQAYMDVSDSKWLRLPKDIDDRPIDEHDKVDWRDHSGIWHKDVLVVAVCSDGCYVMDGTVFHVHASDIRHHKHPITVESVLAEFANKWMKTQPYKESEVIAEYAKRLRLASDAE